MELTMGQIMFWGGIGIAAFSLLMFLILIGVFAAGKKKMIQKLSREY